MSAPPISMRKLKDLLRLKYEAGLSQRQIAGELCLSLGVVNKYLHAAQAAGITWPLPDDLSEAQLRRRMFPPDAAPSPPHYAPVDFLMMAWRCRSDSFLHFSGFNVMGDSSL